MSDKFLTAGSLPAGTTSASIWFDLEDTTTGAPTTGKVAADMVCSYWRQGGLRVAITPTDLVGVDSAYSSGGVKEVDATNLPGTYRLDIPDAALIAAADWVVFGVKVTGCKAARVRLALPTYAALRDAIFDVVIETAGSYTAQQALSILLAALAGQTANSGTTLKTPNGASTRIASTIDGSNNRTAMTLTPSS
jgi:hypothetical protein